jgi:hypothetical protein
VIQVLKREGQMKSLLILFACVVGSGFGQQPAVDKAFFGAWNLDMSRSKFPPGNAPKGGRVDINQNGYVSTEQDPPAGSPTSVALAFVRGECYLIGPFGPTSSCTFPNNDNPRRPSWTVKLGNGVVYKYESELVGETTLTVKTSSTSGPIVVERVYTKATQPPVSTKK